MTQRFLPLTPHEIAVLEPLAAGATYGDIASRIGATINEVFAAIGVICAKLDVPTERDAVRAFTGADLEAALHDEHARRFATAEAA